LFKKKKKVSKEEEVMKKLSIMVMMFLIVSIEVNAHMHGNPSGRNATKPVVPPSIYVAPRPINKLLSVQDVLGEFGKAGITVSVIEEKSYEELPGLKDKQEFLYNGLHGCIYEFSDRKTAKIKSDLVLENNGSGNYSWSMLYYNLVIVFDYSASQEEADAVFNAVRQVK
jgi:hypothetical protein